MSVAKIRMSKKQRKEVASLINSVTVWHDMVKEDIKTESPDKILQYMIWHNRAAKELNYLLGVDAVSLYKGVE